MELEVIHAEEIIRNLDTKETAQTKRHESRKDLRRNAIKHSVQMAVQAHETASLIIREM